jgi:hypothetical protein
MRSINPGMHSRVKVFLQSEGSPNRSIGFIGWVGLIASVNLRAVITVTAIVVKDELSL